MINFILKYLLSLLHVNTARSHLYYTDGLLSHNTETSCAFLLWYAIFHPDKTVLIASNKSSNAMELIGKIQYAYEELPPWLKPGIDDTAWNKHTCSFDNKSRIIATATSKDSGRGLSISLIYCDELRICPSSYPIRVLGFNIADNFYPEVL